MLKAVIDTNVLISGMLNPNGAPGKIVDLMISEKILPVIDDRILCEYLSVLRRDVFKKYFSGFERRNLEEFLIESSFHVNPDLKITGLPDSGDVPFLETALFLKIPLVTGNIRHFSAEYKMKCEIFTPAEFLRVYFTAGF